MGSIKFLFPQLVVILGLIALIEMVVSYTYKTPQVYSLKEWINSVPLAFTGDPDFNTIVKSFDGCSSPAMLHIDGVTSYASDFSCGGVTYENGKRLTLPDVQQYSRTVHVFGGSTVWGTGAIDEKTIPSLLALNLNFNDVRFLNYGFASYISSQQNIMLNAFESDIKEGDFVIYYDGGNDFWNGVMLGNLDGSIIGYNVENSFDVYLYKIKNWLAQNLSTYQLLSDLKHGRGETNVSNCSVSEEHARSNISAAAIHYAEQISTARMFVKGKGATFVHFLQPTLFDVNELNDYEMEVISHDPCWSVARNIKEQYDDAFLSSSPNTIDLSEIFNNTNYFFDLIHVSAYGNQLAVKNIIEHIDFR